ncbi:MAG: aldehyde dehydrogenase family protein [Polyangiaceae bacterium]|nr:aldehyde dehydrogenase family protein [Polyangiaceae bacterium]
MQQAEEGVAASSKDEADGADEAGAPAGGEALPSVTPELDELVARARRAQKDWGATALPERIEALFGLKRRLLERAREIGALLHEECGKPVEEAVLSEVLPNADLVDYWCNHVEELLEGSPVDLDPLSYPGKSGRISKEARGLVALITPWNFPIAIPLRTLVPALLAGNAVLFKPSEITPRAGALVAALFAGLLPEGVLTLVEGGREVGAALVHAGVDLVVFTGSVATGRKVAVACAEQLIPVSLELGGKDAAIVLADARLDRTANGIVWGAFTNAGQNCAAIERVYVVEAIEKELIPRIVAATKALRPGVDTTRMTTEAQRDLVLGHLRAALEGGAELLAGGEPDDPTSLDFPPTVVRLTDEDTPLMCDETFGPILPIVVVKDEAEAVARANASRFGLTTSIWTRKIRHGRELARQLRSGVVTINNHAFTAALPAAPWTGTGETGYGVTNSPHCLSALTRVRFVLEDRNRGARELWWYPYTPALRTVAFSMAEVRGGARFFGRIAAFFRLLGALPKRLFGG